MTPKQRISDAEAITTVEKYFNSIVLVFDAEIMNYFKDANIALYLCYLKRKQFIMQDHQWVNEFGYWPFTLEIIKDELGYSIEQQEEIINLLQDLNMIDVCGDTVRVFNDNIINKLAD